MLDIPDMNLIDYLIAKRDAYIYKLSKTDKGKEYLRNAHRLTQTEPERQKLREHFGGRTIGGK